MLFNVCLMHPEEDESSFRQVANLIRDISSMHSNISQVLLTFLPSLPKPLPFIEIIPTLFAVSTPEVLSDTVHQMSAMVASDNKLLIPVMAALVELPLPTTCIQVLLKMAEEAVSVVDDDDLPLLFKTLIKSMDHINTTSLCAKLRGEIANLPLSSVALVIEVMKAA